MKIALLIAAILVVLSSVPLLAQQTNVTAQQSAAATAGNTHVNQSTGASASAQETPGHAHARGAAAGSGTVSGPATVNGSAYGAATATGQMRPVNAELEKKLDSKSAKVGDQVIAKTRETVRTANGTVIPKGSRLIGHVTEVEAHARGHQDSRMGIEFDRAELKGGQSVAIHSVIRAISPPANALANDSMDDGAMAAPMAPMGGAAMGGGGRMGGGGLLGGTVGGATATTGRMGAGLGSDLGSTTGGAMRTTGNVAGNAAAGVGNGVRGAAGANGVLGTHATAIPGVMLDGNAAGSASGTLTATKRNIHLDSGTQMVLGIAADRQYAGK